MSYSILDNSAAILCLRCGAISYNKHDVAHAYCAQCHSFHDDDALYEVAKRVTHDFGMPWTDPRTGITHEPPKRI